MSRGTRGDREKVAASSRPSHGLRVIEGGRGEARSTPARRYEPTRKIKRRRRVVVGILVILAVGLITYILLGPVTRVLESRRNLTFAEAQLAEEKARTQTLEERKAWDETERFIEWEARKIGYVRPGEIPIVVLDAQPEETATSEEVPDAPAP